jgi:hypothetical protein
MLLRCCNCIIYLPPFPLPLIAQSRSTHAHSRSCSNRALPHSRTGTQFWYQAITLDLGLVRGPQLSVPLLYIILLGMYGLSFLTQIPASWARAFQNNHTLTQPQAMGQVLPVLAYYVLLVIWLTAPASRALEHSFFTLLLGAGVGFGEYAASIILHHLLHDPYPRSAEFLAPVAYMALLTRSNPVWLTPSVEQWLTRLVVALTVVWYALRVRVVIASFCGYLGIQALVIPYPTPAMQLAAEMARQAAGEEDEEAPTLGVEGGKLKHS